MSIDSTIKSEPYLKIISSSLQRQQLGQPSEKSKINTFLFYSCHSYQFHILSHLILILDIHQLFRKHHLTISFLSINTQSYGHSKNTLPFGAIAQLSYFPLRNDDFNAYLWKNLPKQGRLIFQKFQSLNPIFAIQFWSACTSSIRIESTSTINPSQNSQKWI